VATPTITKNQTTGKRFDFINLPPSFYYRKSLEMIADLFHETGGASALRDSAADKLRAMFEVIPPALI
jgi:hypothetical protein